MHSLWKTAWRLLKKLKIELRYDPANSFLDIYLEFEGNIHFDELNQVDPEKGIQREILQTFCLLSFSLLPQLKLKMKLQGKGTQIVVGAGQTSIERRAGRNQKFFCLFFF